MSEENKRKLYIAIGIAIAIFVMFVWPHEDTWDGDGSINAFPSTPSVKNYRLDATMTVTRKWNGWFSKGTYIYTDITGAWPDGGSLELEDCTVTDNNRSDCTDQDGKEYAIEVQSAPDEPEPDTSSDY